MGQIERGESKIQRRASIKRALDAKVMSFYIFIKKICIVYFSMCNVQIDDKVQGPISSIAHFIWRKQGQKLY